MLDKVFENMMRLVQQDKGKEFTLIISPPPNLTGGLHTGHILNLSIIDFHTRYNYIFGEQNIVNIIGYDHAGLSAEIIAKNMINKNTNKSEVLKQIEINTITFKNEIKEQIKKYNFAIVDTNISTIDEESIQIVNKLIQKLEKNQLIEQKLQLYFHDYKNKTIVSDLDVEIKLVTKNLYIIKYFQENTQEYIEVGTTQPGTIEADVCLVCHPNDTRYTQYINKTFLNPLTNNKIKLFTHKCVKQHYGTGVLKVTPIYDKADLIIANELSLKFNMNELPYNAKNLQMTQYSIFSNKCIDNIDNLAIYKLKEGGYITITKQVISKEYIVIRSQSKALTLMSLQYCINLKKLIANSNFKYNLLEITGSDGKNEISRFTKNLQDWTITRQNNYGIEYKNNKLDTWLASSIYISIIINKMNIHLNRKIIIYTGYDIIFYWIYKMHYIQSFYTNQKCISEVIVHGLICDSKGNKMSKSKGNIININYETKEECENYKAGLLCLNIWHKRITYNQQQIDIPKKTIVKLKNIIKLLKLKFSYKSSEYKITTTNTENSLIYDIFTSYMIEIICQNHIDSIKQILNFHNFIKQYFGNLFIEIFKQQVQQNNNYIRYNKIVISMLFLALKYISCFMPIQADTLYKEINNSELIEQKINIQTLKTQIHKYANIMLKILKLQKEKQINTLTITSKDDQDINCMFYTPSTEYIKFINLEKFTIYYQPTSKDINNISVQYVINYCNSKTI